MLYLFNFGSVEVCPKCRHLAKLDRYSDTYKCQCGNIMHPNNLSEMGFKETEYAYTCIECQKDVAKSMAKELTFPRHISSWAVVCPYCGRKQLISN